jgi:DNA-binding response OmpR family regulator
MAAQIKIMVVDDDMSVRGLLYEILAKQNYAVVTAPNGQSAIEMLAKENPALVILDLMIPGLNGLDTFARMRLIDPELEGLMLTGASLERDDLRMKAGQLGISDVLSKGVSDEKILKSVNDILARRKIRPPGPEPKAKGNILVVDDDPDIRFLLEKFFIRQGYQVSTAVSGEMALNRLAKYAAGRTQNCKPKNAPLIVLLDINLGGMDGLVVLKKIKDINNEINVLIISGLNDEALNREAMRLGAYDCITKPFNMEYLETAVMNKLLLAK